MDTLSFTLHSEAQVRFFDSGANATHLQTEVGGKEVGEEVCQTEQKERIIM